MIKEKLYFKLKALQAKNGKIDKSFISLKKRIFLFLVPTHGNLGDQAIAQATIEFLKDFFAEYEICIINFNDTYRLYKSVKTAIKKGDLIFLPGGGNMGDLYPQEEHARRFIINNFRENKIISMPQTINFGYSNNGRRELKETRSVYNQHEQLTLIAREKKSYKLMKEYFPKANVILNPDIVFYLQSKLKPQVETRETIMTCLRSDKESVSNRTNIILSLENIFPDLFIFDTVVSRNIPDKMRKVEVYSILNQFRRTKLVITDRMHGMVFSAITGTPCIVSKSLDHKVTGTYEWIKDLDNIYFVNNLESEKTKEIIKKKINKEDIMDKQIDFKKQYFDNLRQKI